MKVDNTRARHNNDYRNLTRISSANIISQQVVLLTQPEADQEPISSKMISETTHSETTDDRNSNGLRNQHNILPFKPVS